MNKKIQKSHNNTINFMIIRPIKLKYIKKLLLIKKYTFNISPIRQINATIMILFC
jgi:hypothetical protein